MATLTADNFITQEIQKAIDACAEKIVELDIAASPKKLEDSLIAAQLERSLISSREDPINWRLKDANIRALCRALAKHKPNDSRLVPVIESEQDRGEVTGDRDPQNVYTHDRIRAVAAEALGISNPEKLLPRSKDKSHEAITNLPEYVAMVRLIRSR